MSGRNQQSLLAEGLARQGHVAPATNSVCSHLLLEPCVACGPDGKHEIVAILIYDVDPPGLV